MHPKIPAGPAPAAGRKSRKSAWQGRPSRRIRNPGNADGHPPPGSELWNPKSEGDKTLCCELDLAFQVFRVSTDGQARNFCQAGCKLLRTNSMASRSRGVAPSIRSNRATRWSIRSKWAAPEKQASEAGSRTFLARPPFLDLVQFEDELQRLADGILVHFSRDAISGRPRN